MLQFLIIKAVLQLIDYIFAKIIKVMIFNSFLDVFISISIYSFKLDTIIAAHF